jgi:linoleoyl-CoA desaturase
MHDAVHGSFSSISWVNKLLGYTLNLLGGIWEIWKWQHNDAHHMSTNINGKDHDIDLGKYGRLHPSQKWYPWHKYQSFYLPWIVYPFSYFGWVFIFDFQKRNLMKKEGKKVSLLYIICSKLVHLGIFIGIPLLHYSFLEVLSGYMITSLVTGWIIAIVFQLAHVVEETSMVEAPADGKVRFDHIHQINTTADFATNSKILKWFTGGLNFQVEHHLFTKCSHVHYPQIHAGLLQICEEQNITHHEFPTLISAIQSHVRQLKKLGQGE